MFIVNVLALIVFPVKKLLKSCSLKLPSFPVWSRDSFWSGGEDEEDKMERIRGFFFTLDHRHIPYISEVALYLPVLVLIHFWMLFSPHSESWIISVPVLFLRYGGSLFLFGTLDYTRNQILHFYARAMPFLFVGFVINSCEQSVQNLASGESTFQCNSLVLATALFFLFTPQIVMLPWQHTVAILAMISFVYLLTRSNFVDFVYWLFILISSVIAMRGVIESADQLNRNVRQNENLVLQYVAAFITNRFAKFPFCHIFSTFFISYYTCAFICEFHNGLPLQALVSMSTLINITGKWCTSFIVLSSILSIIVLAGKVIIIMIHYCLITEREDRQWLRQLFDTGGVNNMWRYFYGFALMVVFLNLKEEERVNVFSTMLQFTFAAFLNDIWFMLKSFITQIGANAAERQLQVYIEVLICIMIPIVVSILVSLNIANQYELGIVSALCTLQCLKLVFDAILTYMEYIVNMISWFYNIDFMRTQDIIYYISLSKSIGIIICFILESYHRLFFPLFPQNIYWRVFLVISGLLILTRKDVVPILLSEYIRYVQRTESRAGVNSLLIATPEQLSNLDDVCAICMDEIDDGLVTPCKHIFHRECLRRACAIRQLCPLCNEFIFQNKNARKIIEKAVKLINQLDMLVEAHNWGDDYKDDDNDDDDDDSDNHDDNDDNHEIGMRY